MEIEKILTMSAGDYCNMVRRDISIYKAIGVHANYTDIQGFADKIPKEAEVVVDYRMGLSDKSVEHSNLCAGTALIPKIPREE